MVLGWVLAILMSGLRLYVTNRWVRREKQQVIGAEFDEDRVVLTKFEKPIAEMTTEERKEAARRHTENVLRNLDKDKPD